MNSWRNNLCELLSEVELSDKSTYDKCFSRKLEFFSKFQGQHTAFALDEKASQILLLAAETPQTDVQQIYQKRTLLLTPMPTLRISSLLLSPDGLMMAILTRTSVQVFDTKCKICLDYEDSTPIVKRIYCAFDCMDFMPPEKSRVELLRVRWHPCLKNMLVVLTTDSRIFFIQCSKLSASSGINCQMRFNLDLGDFQRCVTGVAAYSDTENASVSCSDDEDDINSLNRSSGKLDLERVLGGSCVDFDFGLSHPQHNAKWRLEKDQDLDCCLYLLCESGCVLRISNCLSSVRNPSSLKIQTLRILPPSTDNYGDEFCALMSFSTSYCSESPDRIFTTEALPDVLVIANRYGRLYQGVVLQSTGRGSKYPDSRMDDPALCLVDVVDLHLHDPNMSAEDEFLLPGSLQNDPAQSPLSGTGTVIAEGANWGQLVLEPARIVRDTDACPGISWPIQTGIKINSYPYLAYYVIHDTGIHLVRVPWLQQVSQWCRKLPEDPLATDATPEQNFAVEKVKGWQTNVQHLICGKLTVVSDNSVSADGQFRVSGLMELPVDLNPLADKSNPHMLPGSAGTLLVIRAPDRISKNKDVVASLLVPVSIELNRSEPLQYQNSEKPRRNDTRMEKSDENTTVTTPRSEFKLHLQRLLKTGGSGLPVITGLSTQTNLTQIQLVQFFLKATELLRSGPLDRLTRARAFVEQYTSRLADHLSVQYQEAVKLTEIRRTLQENAERLSKQHAFILERQQQIDKRLSFLADRVAGLCNGPTKVDVGMHDEVIAVRDRLRKGLKKWFGSLRSRQSLLEERLARVCPTRSGAPRTPKTSTDLQNEDTEAEVRRVSYLIKQETADIKYLVDSIKLLNARYGSQTV